MKRLIIRSLVAAAIVLSAINAAASRVKFWGYAERGGMTVITALTGSSNYAQRSFPLCPVQVYVDGTTSAATIYSNFAGTVIPSAQLTTNSVGYFEFWGDSATYSVKFSPVSYVPWTITGFGAAGGAGSQLSVNILDFGAKCDRSTDDTVAIQAALNWSATGHRVDAPAGGCVVTTTLTINFSRVNFLGVGPVATQLIFAPTANNIPLLSYISSPSGSVINQCEFGNMGITSADTTRAKIGIRLTDVSQFYLHDFQIGPNGAWNGTSGGTTIGVQIRGRDLSRLNRFEISCTDGIPIKVESNPNTALGGLEDLDVWTFENFHLVPGSGHWGFEFADGAQPTDVDISRFDVGSGAGIFKFVNTLSGSVAYGLHIHDGRGEVSSGGSYIYIDAGSGAASYGGIKLDRLSLGQGASQKGIFLRHAHTITVSEVYTTTAAGVSSIDFDAVRGLKLLNNFWLGGSLMTKGANMALVNGKVKSFDGTAPGYLEENWEDTSSNSNVAAGNVFFLGGPLGGASGGLLYAMSGTITNNTQLPIPMLGGGAILAQIRVSAKGTTKIAFGTAGISSLAPGTPPTLLSNIAAGNDFQLGNVPGKLTVFDGGSGMSTITLFNQTGETMSYLIVVELTP